MGELVGRDLVNYLAKQDNLCSKGITVLMAEALAYHSPGRVRVGVRVRDLRLGLEGEVLTYHSLGMANPGLTQTKSTPDPKRIPGPVLDPTSRSGATLSLI